MSELDSIRPYFAAQTSHCTQIQRWSNAISCFVSNPLSIIIAFKTFKWQQCREKHLKTGWLANLLLVPWSNPEIHSLPDEISSNFNYVIFKFAFEVQIKAKHLCICFAELIFMRSKWAISQTESDIQSFSHWVLVRKFAVNWIESRSICSRQMNRTITMCTV